jgi:DNA-binding NtrC family response regulator
VSGRSPTLLVVDDDPQILPIVARYAEPLGYTVVYRSGGAEALASFADIKPDVAIVDLQMPDVGGLDVLRAIRDAEPECQVILMTGNPTVETAIESVKRGALDYLAKPFDSARLRGLLTTVRDDTARRARLLAVEAEIAGQMQFHGMIGRAPVMQDLFDTIRRMAPHARTMLVTGETGTGKELVAKALHALGERSARRFVTVNCSAVVETLFESELFGHVRGAFTGATDHKIGVFEHATGGTLFLDEVGELPLSVQAKLLRAVEYGEIQRVGSLEGRRVDVAVIAATNRELRVEAAAGRFRSDLYYRLAIVEIRLPPLRDRREDIPYLVAAFVRDCAQRLERPISGVTAHAERLMQQASWPGNVRELRNVIERACLLSDGPILSERDLASAMARGSVPAAADSTDAAEPPPSATLLSTAQREQIERVLRETGGNKARAAKLLGVSRRSLYRWLDRLDLKD